jgi:hypothetical protein
MGVVVVSERETQRYLLFDQTSRLCGWTNIATGEVRPASLASHLHNLQRSDLQPNGRSTGAADLPHSDLSPLAFSGMQLLNPRIFDHMDEFAQLKGDKFSLIDLYVYLAEKEILRAFIPENYRMMDVGKINQLSEAESFAQSL